MSAVYMVLHVQTPDWTQIPKTELQETGWLQPAGIRAFAQVCHDDENLYIRMEAEETHIRAEETETLSQVCEDSCLEFFFAPDVKDQRYLNFEWNPLGTLFLGIGTGRGMLVRQIVRSTNDLFGQKVFYTRNGWGISYRIPLAFIRLYFPEFAMQGESAGNFYKCGDLTETPHYLAWSKPTSETPDFHRRGDFGKLVFE